MRVHRITRAVVLSKRLHLLVFFRWLQLLLLLRLLLLLLHLAYRRRLSHLPACLLFFPRSKLLAHHLHLLGHALYRFSPLCVLPKKRFHLALKFFVVARLGFARRGETVTGSFLPALSSMIRDQLTLSGFGSASALVSTVARAVAGSPPAPEGLSSPLVRSNHACSNCGKLSGARFPRFSLRRSYSTFFPAHLCLVTSHGVLY